jgi:hypothetical protein
MIQNCCCAVHPCVGHLDTFMSGKGRE